MNERIEKLLKKAQKITAENHAPGGRDYEREIYSKFAELIVRECINVIGEENYTMLTGKAYCTELKRHFGVEE